MSSRADVAHVLDVDPDLARDLDETATRQAREQLVARVETITTGRRQGPWGPADPRGHVGLMVVEGIILRQLSLGRARCAELLGPPDLLRPWDLDGGGSLPDGSQIEWEILAEARLAVLDLAFVRRAAAWPEVVAALAARGIWRAQAVAIDQAISNVNRVDERILLLFSHLAQRWGRVKSEGVVLELPLTHELLARLAGAQRPSVTTALGQLSARGLVRRLPDRTWLLPHEAAVEVRTVGSVAEAGAA